MPSDSCLNFFATTPKGLEPLLANELRDLGAEKATETVSGVSFYGTLEVAYRACLWSRIASRIYLPLSTFPASTPEELYDNVRLIPWEEHLSPEGTLRVSCNVSASKITHSHYAALKVKDAIVDQFRDTFDVRPSVSLSRPDLCVNAHIQRDMATISIDLAGESLHRRGYREEGVEAPLKENLAAAILLYSKWPSVAKEGGALVDLMCGSGTLPIEAAMISADIAPGLMRTYFGFIGWKGHDQTIWESLIKEAEERQKAGLSRLPDIFGFDRDPLAIKASSGNAKRAGLEGKIKFEQREVSSIGEIKGLGSHGLVIVNPPYGERLGSEDELKGLYLEIGDQIKRSFVGWKGAVFTGTPGLGKELRLRPRRVRTLYNGAIECKLLHYDIEPRWFYRDNLPSPLTGEGQGGGEPYQRVPPPLNPLPQVEGRYISLTPGAEMFANRLRKNLKSLGTWAEKNGISCYRLYDADMPEYSVAIDIYEKWAHIQEYEAPKSIDQAKADMRLKEVMAVLPGVLQIPAERIFLKVRKRQKGTSQYPKFDDQRRFHQVREGNCTFLVNFTDYLDTGLFLDHRPTRFMLQEMAKGKRFLNLFGYTGTVTVHAAKGGAVSTTTVDMSKTYIEWARKNLALNGFTGPNQEFVQADCLEWLALEKRQFDLIFLDPPTFSNSKRMDGIFDVQRDHVELLKMAVKLLNRDGILIFSNNNRKFKMDIDSLSGLKIEDITQKTIPKDFERNPRIHNCWKMTL
ncbi:MAG: bifunctional 23S rRNA (guanine(2069)-N(7))-methyltransferase RlmK/23S rRNA (guanine(2445)-N(2))-methyltransferase RlmL [Deltaproteobacteria bacterium]|nr:bifunctional 23S rRNA (guanine(2069)-N(7))-methyltransferase RlmK/23S rRNA (guanine(2445)-N(2))-methyltransferase RlmL [Deltaproteobacteria bacterium]